MISDARLRRVLPAPAVALLGDLIRWMAWALVLTIWAAFGQVYLRMIRLTLADPTHSDFTIFYYTARFVADGLPMYGLSPARYGVPWAADHLGNLNPPHFQLLAAPLAYLTYAQALGAWVTLNLLALTAAMVVIVRELGIRWSWPRFFLWGAFTLSLAPFTTVAVTSEMTFVLMVPFSLAWRACRNGRWRAAGLWLGACASLKLFLLLFVPWLAWRRQWRALAAFALSASALVAVGAGVFGIQAYREWLTTLGRVGWWWLPMNASWQGLLSRTLEGGATVTPLLRLPGLVRPLALAGSLALAVVALLAARPATGRAEPGDDRSFLVVLLGAVLASPLGWVYYLPLAYGPILGWIRAGRGWGRLAGLPRPWLALLLAGVALLYVPHEATFVGQPSGLASVTIGSAYFWGTLALWLTLVASPRA
jgi:Glycosyltransferase family 87